MIGARAALIAVGLAFGTECQSRPSLDALADIVQRKPSRPPNRARSDADPDSIAQAQKIGSIGARVLPALIYGETPLCDDCDECRGGSRASPATTSSVRARWLRPDNMEIFVVSNCRWRRFSTSRAAFGPGGARVAQGAKSFAPPAPSRLNGSCWSTDRLTAIRDPPGQITPIDPRGEIAPVTVRMTSSAATSIADQHDLREPRAGHMACAAPRS